MCTRRPKRAKRERPSKIHDQSVKNIRQEGDFGADTKSSSTRTEQPTNTRGKLDVLGCNSEAQLTRQQKIALSGRDLDLDGHIFVICLLSNADNLVSGFVVAELVAESQINAGVSLQ